MLSRRLGKLIAFGVLTMGTVRCGGNVTLGGVAGDAGHGDRGGIVGHVDATADARHDSVDAGHGHDSGHTSPDAAHKSPPRDEAGVLVDAGIYHGDGAFFVDGGAYPDATPHQDAPIHDDADGATDALRTDAASSCTALAACCPSLSGASQSLCTDFVSQGNGASCASALAQLEDAGSCNGVTALVTEIQLPPTQLLSDGTTLFFTDGEQTSGLLAVPVGGGAVTMLVSSGVELVAVDNVNVYFLQNQSFIRLPKNGGAPTLVNETDATVAAATTLGATAYWVEEKGAGLGWEFTLKRAPMLGGLVTTVEQSMLTNGEPVQALGVTSSAIVAGSPVEYLPMTGAPATPAQVDPKSFCLSLASDADAVYCDVGNGSNLRIASDGTTAVLGPAVGPSSIEGNAYPYITYDDTYAYWVDNATAGTIMKAPKAGGGTATIVARDTSPIAVAVDANYVYWSDQAGNIERIAK